MGPIRIQNNYMAVAAVPAMIMANGARINDPNDHQRDILVEHNYFYKPYKWFAVSGPDYVGNFKYVFKNGFEMKGGEDARIQYNMVENGGDGVFEGQSFGMTLTVRTNYSQLNGVVDSKDARRLSVASYSTFATDALPWQIVGATNDGGSTYAWRAIGSLDLANNTFVVAGDPFPFTGDVTVLWIRHPWKRLKNVTVENNLIKNAAIPWQTLGADPVAYRDAGFYPDGGHGVNITIRNNLAWSDAMAHKTTDLGVVNIYAQYGGVFEHNTVHQPVAFTQKWVAQLGDGAYVSSAFSKNRGFTYQNNIHRRGSYGMFSGGLGEGKNALNQRFEDGYPFLFRNNTLDGAARSFYEPCAAPRDCSGNFFPATYDPGFLNVEQEDFRLGPSSPYRNAATDGTDAGADMTKLPLVLELRVSPSTTSAILEYDVTDPLKDQTGVLEVSTNRNLISDRCDGAENAPCYQVIADLDPTTTLHADLDSREGNQKTDRHRIWQLGFRVPLIQGTTYYYRLMVGGVTKRGQFTTSSQPKSHGPRVPGAPAPPGTRR